MILRGDVRASYFAIAEFQDMKMQPALEPDAGASGAAEGVTG